MLIDDFPPCGESARSLLFADPVEILSGSVESVSEAIDRATSQGLWAAGLFSYDGGSSLDRPFKGRHVSSMPDAWFGLYRSPRPCPPLPAEPSAPKPGRRELNVTKAEYLEALRRAKAYIEAGDVYQVNLTVKLRFQNPAGAASLFRRLRAAHPVGHAAFVNAGDWQVASLSPELFLRRRGWEVTARPMKGTARRGHTFEWDDREAAGLAADPKNRAENLMIVDLMRNDLGRVCQVDSIAVPRLFEVERYRSVLQMTSDVVGRLRPGTTNADLLRASFPPGSVTGAPKLRAMKIIDELEAESRGVYCGAIGCFGPGGEAVLNVAIRTVVQRGEQCEVGIGSGIVADSDPESEWGEVLLKSAFLDAEPWTHEVFETLFASRQGFRGVAEHLARMTSSCLRLGVPCEAESLGVRLARELEARTDGGPWRVRASVDAGGAVRTEWRPFTPWPERPLRVRLSETRTDPAELRFVHKTTDRADYDGNLAEAREAGFDEVLFANRRGEATEGSISNLFALIDGRWVTPALESGLLPGIWRAWEIERLDADERALALSELARAERIVMGNSVRGGADVGELCDANGMTVWPNHLSR